MPPALLLSLVSSLAAHAQEAPLDIGLSFQPRLTATLDGAPEASAQAAVTEVGLRIRRMLLTARGTVARRIDYRLRANLAPGFTFEDADGTTQQGGRPVLDDAQVIYRLAETVQISVGQWKVPFTLSQAMGDTSLLLPDRPIVLEGFKTTEIKADGFTWSRDAGAAVLGRGAGGRLAYALGVFNGDGQNTWPPSDKAPLVAGRLQVSPLGEMVEDEVDLRQGEPRLALGLSGAREAPAAFSEAGARLGRSSDLRVGGDFRLLARGLSVQTEVLVGRNESADATEGATRTGVYAQVGYCLPVGLAPGLRWSRLDPSAATADDALSQIEAVVNLYLPDPARPGTHLGHRGQLQLHGATTFAEGLAHPVGHQVQLAAALGI